MRTVTQRADRVRAGNQLLIINRLAEVTGIKVLVERGELGVNGPVHAPEPYYWVELTFVWVAPKLYSGTGPKPPWDPPESALCIEGNAWMSLREAGD